MRPLLVLLIAVTPVSAGVAPFGVVADAAPVPQMASVWSPESGWQLVREHPIDPDLVVIGMFGERWVDPNAPPPRTGGSSSSQKNAKTTRRVDTANMPRLMLNCENGATAVTLVRPPKQLERSRTDPSRRSAQGESAFAMDGDGVVALVFDDEERIDIDLRNTPRRADPIYLPDPFDTIQRLLRQETLYYYEITRGRHVSFSFTGEWSPIPDAVFHLEGLGEFLDTTRDPCGWGG